jgi:hypothetical protein
MAQEHHRHPVIQRGTLGHAYAYAQVQAQVQAQAQVCEGTTAVVGRFKRTVGPFSGIIICESGSRNPPDETRNAPSSLAFLGIEGVRGGKTTAIGAEFAEAVHVS